jgi:hypothetical protein
MSRQSILPSSESALFVVGGEFTSQQEYLDAPVNTDCGHCEQKVSREGHYKGRDPSIRLPDERYSYDVSSAESQLGLKWNRVE